MEENEEKIEKKRIEIMQTLSALEAIATALIRGVYDACTVGRQGEREMEKDRKLTMGRNRTHKQEGRLLCH